MARTMIEPAKTGIAWPSIEADYRAGIKSLRQIASQQGVSEGAIRKRAKKEDWQRDLAAKIQAKAEALVRNEAVRSEVRSATRVPEHVVIEANAVGVFEVRISQRTDIQRAGRLFRSLLAELEAQTDNLALFQQLGELLDQSGPDENGKHRRDLLNELYQKIISTVGRVDSSKKLVEMLEKLVRMEREAFGIEGAGSDGNDPLTSLLARIGRSAMPVIQDVPDDGD
ncbi:hypothetical protein D9M72_430800 [compost metagenome]